ncbi:nSTAND1 domain-containing NTPase [Micromonospora parva]|uniref:nSTAND1 domain-containing NTPase n=1 Tax=Micromonospora parva TaxID=1464048 RepID=UPI0033CAB6BF
MPDDMSSRRFDPHLADIRTRSEFGRELTRLRQDAGLTVRDVARATGVPASTLGGYFAGTHLPPLKPPELLTRILRACGTTDSPMVEQWHQALARARRAPGPRPMDAPVPYRGLAHFEAEHAEWFYGRERLVADLVTWTTKNTRGGLLTVVGASGSGKSSLLRAGLLAALATKPSGQHWQTLIITPGPRPLHALATPLATLTGRPASALADELTTDPAHLRTLMTHLSPSDHQPRRIAIVVDQFEELFTTCRDDVERKAFVEAIRAAGALPPPTVPGSPDATPVVVALGLRADFYTVALRHPPIAEALQNAQLIVGPMSEAELRNAIVQPARRAGVDVDDALVDMLIHDLHLGRKDDHDAAQDIGLLPLLSHALLTTWERSDHNRLTVPDYRKTGGIRSAVARTAEEAYLALTPDQQAFARRLFLRLVQVSDEAAETRRYVPHAEVRGLGRDAQHVLDVFIACRLVTAGADRVTLTHEALLFAWPRLRSWIDADRTGLQTHRQLTVAANTWQELGRDPHALYRGSRLSMATEWAADPDHHADLTPPEREFLNASVAHHEAEQRTTRRRSRILRQLLTALTVLSIAFAASAAYALQQKRAAEQQRNLAVARQVATVADQVRVKDVALGRQLALAAYRIAPVKESRSALLNSYAAPTVTRISGSEGVMQTMAFNADGSLMAAGGSDKTVRLWNVARSGAHTPAGTALTGHTDTIYSVAFNPAGNLLASAGGDGTIRVWDVTDPQHVSAVGAPITDANATIYAVAFSPDGRVLAAGSADSRVRLYDMTHPSQPLPMGPSLTGFSGYVQSVAFSPDGSLLAAGSADTTVRLWALRHPTTRHTALRAVLRGPTKVVYSVVFSPDGRRLAAGSADGSVHLWNVGTPARPLGAGTLTGPSSWVNSVAFSPDNRRVAAGSSDGNLWVWDTATRDTVVLQRHPAPLTVVTFTNGSNSSIATAGADGIARLWQFPGPLITSPTASVFTTSFTAGHTVAVTALDNTGSLWNVTDPRQPAPLTAPIRDLNGPETHSGAAALSPDGRILATGDRAGSVRLWNVADPHRPTLLPRHLTAHTTTIQSLAFSADGKLLAVGSSDTSVSLWSLTQPERPVQLTGNLPGPGNYVLSVALSPDGRVLAAGGADNTVQLWDITDPHTPRPLGQAVTGPTKYVYAVAFSPNSQLLAVGSADNTVRLYDVTNPRSPKPLGQALTGPDNYVYSVAFSADGRRLAASAGDGTVWLWDTTDPRQPHPYATITAHDKSAYVVAFDTGSTVLATGSADHTIRLWNIDPDQVAAHICATVGASITRDEWNKYLPAVAYAPPCP